MQLGFGDLAVGVEESLLGDAPHDLSLGQNYSLLRYFRLQSVQPLKGVSSRDLRQERPDLFRWRALQHALWSPSYFAASCGGAPLMAIKRYIQQQQTPQ